MQHSVKRWSGVLLAVCMVMAMLPTVALAADTGKAIQLVGGSAANIGGGQADNVFFGNYFQSNSTTKDPVKWRVLSNAGGQLFLLADQNLDVFQYHTEEEAVTWETSAMRSWLNGYGASANTGGSTGIDYTNDNFLKTAFSADEQAAIAQTHVVNDPNPDYDTDGGNDTTDRIFLLSISEAYNRSYFPKSGSDLSTNTAYVAAGGKLGKGMQSAGEYDWWWLRSSGFETTMAAFIEWEGGSANTDGQRVNYDRMAVRPAFNLSLSSVLFTSAADSGKSASGMDNGLAAVAAYSGKDWKLTLLDSARTFAVSDEMQGGNTVTFSYSGAQTGPKEYLSAVIVEGDAVAYYGRILKPSSASGTASLTLPEGVTLSGTTKLYVFNEQYNGDRQTDYASALRQVTPAAVQAPSITTTALTGGATDDAYSQTLAAKGTAPIIWTITSGSLPDGLALSGDTISGTPTAAGTFTFVVQAANAAGSDLRELSIVIHSAPVIIGPDDDEDILVTEGGSVTLRVSARDALSFQWYVDDGSGFKAIPGATAASYTIMDFKPEDDGDRYYCLVTNTYGSEASSIFTLKASKSVNLPATGDSSQMGLWIGLAMLSFAGLATCAALWRRKRIS